MCFGKISGGTASFVVGLDSILDRRLLSGGSHTRRLVRGGHGIAGGTLDRHQVWMPIHCPAKRLFLWAPPPAAADAALEQLLLSRHKRTDLYHVVVIPRLVTPKWRRLFNKVCDFSLVVPTGCSFWPDQMFEPLWLGIVLPCIDLAKASFCEDH